MRSLEARGSLELFLISCKVYPVEAYIAVIFFFINAFMDQGSL